MPRSGEPARTRLQQAALDLFREGGYDATTAAQIAARAGVTERTFFRHFADKREVLFDGEEAVRADFDRGVADAPDGSDPLTMLLQAFRTAIPRLEGNRSFAEPRNAVIIATPALAERALTKEAALIRSLTDALQRRGVAELPATLAARIGMAAFTQAIDAWFDHPGSALEGHLVRSLDDVRALASGP